MTAALLGKEETKTTLGELMAKALQDPDAADFAALRQAYPALRRGSYQRLYADREVVAFGRWLDEDRLVVVLNTSTAAKTVDIPVQPIGLMEGALTDAFQGDHRWTIAHGILHQVKVPPRSGLVLL